VEALVRKRWLTVAGGFCGALTRYLLGAPLLALAAALPLSTEAFPYDTLAINLSGALLLGALIGLVEHDAPVAPDMRLTVGTGFLGAYTTFSSFMVGADTLVIQGHPLAAVLYVCCTWLAA
jgi:fluoride exporter